MCFSVNMKPINEIDSGRAGGAFSLWTLMFLLLVSTFTSGFLAGVLSILWFVCDIIN